MGTQHAPPSSPCQLLPSPYLPSPPFLCLIACATRTMQTTAAKLNGWTLKSETNDLYNPAPKLFGLTVLSMLGTYQSNKRVERMTHKIHRTEFLNTGCQSVSLCLLDLKLN